LNNSPARWKNEPAPDEPKLKVTVVPGFAASKSDPICVNAAVREDAANTVSSVVPPPLLPLPVLADALPDESLLFEQATSASETQASATSDRVNRILRPPVGGVAG
jgi:hypothetical protein